MCEYFEGILKIISLLKQLVSSASGVGSNQLRTTGILALLPPGAEELGSAIHSSCVELIQHIVNQANSFSLVASHHTARRGNQKRYSVISMWCVTIILCTRVEPLYCSVLAMLFKRCTVPPYNGSVPLYWVKPHPLYPFLVDFQ